MSNYFITALFMLAVIGILNGIINYFFLWENNGKKYYQQYIKGSKQVRVIVTEKNFDEIFGYTSYLKYTIGFKGIMGGSEDYMFEDIYTHRYFKIMRFDLKISINGSQDKVISGEELSVMVDNSEFNDSSFGTITKPIHVFSYKGIQKTMGVNIQSQDGSIGIQSIEPTQQEYENNVINYLTYVMPEKEFDERFGKEK